MTTALISPTLDRFHEDVRAWFLERFGRPTEAQIQAWPRIAEGGNVLVAAPTGSGKTLAAFLWAIDRLWRRGLEGDLPRQTLVLYISPLKALSHDVKKNLEDPLREIRDMAFREHMREAEIHSAVRTGDTPAGERQGMLRQPPHILITTPESLYLLLTSTQGRSLLRTIETVIVDEVHALAGNRRGAHLALSLERLEALTEKPLQRIGLSATQKPLELVAQFLTGTARPGRDTPCFCVDAGRRRTFDLQVEIPASGLSAVMALEVWEEVYARLLALIAQHRTTLIFVSTRRMAERIAHRLRQTLGDEAVAAHHGSMSRERRLDAEQRLKSGALKALAATSSLELGIDIGSVDLVVQIGSPKTINAFLQRAGRSRHQVGGVPKARLFPLTLSELVESAALLRSVRQGELDALWIPDSPLDVLAQQIVAETACREWRLDDLYAIFRRAHPYRHLTPEKFLEIVQIVAQGYTTRRGRRGAHLHFDAVNGLLRGRPGARLTALLNGGAIPDAFDYEVRLEPGDQLLGTVNEDFAVESMAGDVFLLGNGTWRILRVEENAVRVADAQGEAPSLPFWLGEAPARSVELCTAISELGREIESRLGNAEALRVKIAAQGTATGSTWKAEALDWVQTETQISAEAANGIVDYLASGLLALGVLPKQETLVAERFFDTGGDMHLVLHCPYGGRVNRAFGLALRKRFCRKFNFELQAAATEEGLILSLGATHSFPLEEVFDYLRSHSVRGILEQAVLDSPMFEVRWRWNATRFLALARRRGGKRVPPILQRLDAQDLVALIFPDQIACAENLTGERQIPDHPLVRQTLDDCLHEAMDIEGLEALLLRVEQGTCRCESRDVSEPSPLAQELLQARPYAFLDGAPLEERRTRAVASQSSRDPAHITPASLDPEAVRSVTEEAWPSPRDADELHDALLTGGFLTAAEIREGKDGVSWEPWLQSLSATHRVGSLRPADQTEIWIASERWSEARCALPQAVPGFEPKIPEALLEYSGDAEKALRELVRGRLEMSGPLDGSQLAKTLGLEESAVNFSLMGLESEGFVFRGHFTPFPGTRWCERRLLFRMRQRSVSQRRQSAVAVSAARYQDFLFRWQGLKRREGARGDVDSLASVLETLEGFEAPGELWEKELLPGRVPGYDPAWLDSLCQSGRFGFGRLRPPEGEGVPPPFLSLRHMPLAFFPRARLRLWKRRGGPGTPVTAGAAGGLYDQLRQRGAVFADDLFAEARLLSEEAERGLRVLIHSGLAACDSFAGLRNLWRPLRGGRAPASSGWRPAGRHPSLRPPPGRFFLFPETPTSPTPFEVEEDTLYLARILLRRYGVVFRKGAEREPLAPPWRELRRALRILEDRGKARGGRFVTGITGEQFALPEALEMLYRDEPSVDANPVVLSAGDPANFQGILTPERRVAQHPKNRVLFVEGIPVLAWEAQEFRELAKLSPEQCHGFQILLKNPTRIGMQVARQFP